MEKSNMMTIDFFINERSSHDSSLQMWINSDEDTVILECDKRNNVAISLITDKIYERNDTKKDAQAWGVPFAELARFVDAVRAMQANATKD